MEDSIRIYPHLQDTGGFFVAVLQHRRSAAASKYIHISFCLHKVNFQYQGRKAYSRGGAGGDRYQKSAP